jgi:hypothetical protein
MADLQFIEQTTTPKDLITSSHFSGMCNSTADRRLTDIAG